MTIRDIIVAAGVTAVFVAGASAVLAHGGGLAADGCHTRDGERHWHEDGTRNIAGQCVTVMIPDALPAGCKMKLDWLVDGNRDHITEIYTVDLNEIAELCLGREAR